MAVKRIAMIFSVLLVSAAAFLRLRAPARSGPAPNIDALKDVLERSASNSLPAPDVMNGKLTILVAKESVASETERIIRLASQAGGTAFKSTASGDPEVLASIPAGQAARFVEAATGKTNPVTVPADPAAKELFDVVIMSSAISSPAP